MQKTSKDDLRVDLSPYTFVFTEGKEIKKDLLDYTVSMLQMGYPEIISSPPEMLIQQAQNAIQTTTQNQLAQAMFERNFSSR